MTHRLGFDIGGTFTDYALVDPATGHVAIHKTLTAPDDPARGALDGLASFLERVGVDHWDLDHAIHATTLVANALIEHKGALVGLITTRGFRDVLEMGTEQRYDIYDLFLRFPPPLAPRYLRRGVRERVDRDGRVLENVDRAEVEQVLTYFRREGVQAIAVSFLHSFRNPVNEQRVAEIIERVWPQVPVSLSSQVAPEIREYERTSTTVANAYVQPDVAHYLRTLRDELTEAGFSGPVYPMLSSASIAPLSLAIEQPIRLVESGPAAGAVLAAYCGGLAGAEDLLSFDMGGTTAKLCLIQGGRPAVSSDIEVGRVHRFKKGSGYPLRLPTVEMLEVGAGGGSLAWIDSLGLLKVGPASAAADPGPAAYGFGGTAPTVTDADLVLGYLNPDYFLGGEMRLDLEAAHRVLGKVAEPLGLSPIEVADGIYRLVNENMASAARLHVIEKAQDPRRFALVCFGGAGPVHAAGMARILGSPAVIVPPQAGVASAIGLLLAPPAFDFVRSFPTKLRAADWGRIEALLTEMEAQGRDLLRQTGTAGQAVVERSVDGRFEGQLHEIQLSIPGDVGEPHLTEFEERFKEEYRRLYRHLPGDIPVELLTWRVRVAAEPDWAPDAHAPPKATSNRDAGAARKGAREAYFGELESFVETPIYDRYLLVSGMRFSGPALVEERESTTVIRPGMSAEVDDRLNLILSFEEQTSPWNPQADLEEAPAVAFDPVSLEILWHRLIAIVDEMAAVLVRTSFSTVVSAANDFGCELMDASGRSLAHATRSMPVFNRTLPHATRALLAKHGADIRPGDVFITNDPWLNAGHHPDVAVITPFFRDEELVGFAASIAHLADIGGTLDHDRATECFEEGLLIPICRLYKAGELQEVVTEFIATNVRAPESVVGDIHAQVASNQVGAEKILGLLDEYDLPDLAGLAGTIQERSEQAMRRAIAEVPDGEYRSRVEFDELDGPLHIECYVEVRGEEITVDFSGSSPQQPRGGINCTYVYTRGQTSYSLKCILLPEVPSNAGVYRPIHIEAPEGSILNARSPASVQMRTRTGWYIHHALFRALADVLPDRVMAPGGLLSAWIVYGPPTDGRNGFHSWFFNAGGMGAGTHTDGLSTCIYPSSASAVPVELFEVAVPVLVGEKEFLTDSGGPGRQRGGLGQRVSMSLLPGFEGTATLSMWMHAQNIPPFGLGGGLSGSAAVMIIDGDVPETREGRNRLNSITLSSPDRTITQETAGGGGFGSPTERDRGAVRDDVRNGYLSTEAARRLYGFLETDISTEEHRG